MGIKYEYRRETKRTHDVVLQSGDMGGRGKYNFRSTYGYPETTSNRILSNGHTRDLKGLDIYSDVLLIDIDECDNVSPVLKALVREDVCHHTYLTGNRGMHIHVPVVPMEGQHVIYSQIQWLKSIGIWDLIDQSVYRETGQFRTIGARHSKTRRYKEWDSTYGEGRLAIMKLTPPPIPEHILDLDRGEATPANVQHLMMNLMLQRPIGQRRPHMFVLYHNGIDSGMVDSEIKELIMQWNNNQHNPHSDRTVQTFLRGIK